MKVLVHYDAVTGESHGLWWQDRMTGEPRNLYHDSESPQAARGRLIMFNKSNHDVSWDEWFDQLTTRAPYSENWIVYDSMGLSPMQLLHALAPAEPLVS